MNTDLKTGQNRKIIMDAIQESGRWNVIQPISFRWFQISNWIEFNNVTCKCMNKDAVHFRWTKKHELIVKYYFFFLKESCCYWGLRPSTFRLLMVPVNVSHSPTENNNSKPENYSRLFNESLPWCYFSLKWRGNSLVESIQIE